MNTLALRLEKAMKGPPKIRAAALARACKIKQPSVSDWLSGRTKRLEGANLLSAARFLGVNPEWLATGKPPMKVGGADGSTLVLAPGPIYPEAVLNMARRIAALSPAHRKVVETALIKEERIFHLEKENKRLRAEDGDARHIANRA